MKSPTRSLFIGLEEEAESSFNSSQLRPKQSVKKLTVKVNTARRTSDSILFNSRDSIPNSDSLPTTPRNGKLPLNLAEVTPNNLQKTPENQPGLQGPVEPLELDSVRKDFKDRLDESSFLDSDRSTPVDFNETTTETVHPAGIKLSRPDYETKPKLVDIPGLDENGQCWVKGFTIMRKNYGQIHWPGRADIANLNLDRIVEIKRKAVSVYPEEIETEKPEQGNGLNQKAEVSLVQTYPREKSSNEIIRDPERLERMGWPQKLERATEKIGGRFLDYDLATGTWSFSVQHFSKYELAESDDEIDENAALDNLKAQAKIASLPIPKLSGPIPVKPSPLVANNIGQSENAEVVGLGGTDRLNSGDQGSFEEPQKYQPFSRQSVNNLPTADTLLGCQKIQVHFQLDKLYFTSYLMCCGSK